MNVEITGRHVQVTEDLQEYAREKAGKVGKFLRRDVRIEVVLDREHDQWQVEMVVSGARGPVIVGHVQHPEARAAVDLAAAKIEHQLRRQKERRKEHRGPSYAGEPSEALGTAAPAGASPPAGESEDASIDDVLDEELNP